MVAPGWSHPQPGVKDLIRLNPQKRDRKSPNVQTLLILDLIPKHPRQRRPLLIHPLALKVLQAAQAQSLHPETGQTRDKEERDCQCHAGLPPRRLLAC